MVQEGDQDCSLSQAVWESHRPAVPLPCVSSPTSKRGLGCMVPGAAEGLSAIFALHNWPYTPSGTIAACAGPIMSATRCFEARISGVGGHGGMPHTTVDPIVAVTATVSALQVPSNL